MDTISKSTRPHSFSMSKLQFVYQETLEELISQGKAHLEGFCLSVNGTALSYLLTPVVRILSCESSPDDPLNILDKFIPLTTLESAGADIYLNSIILQTHSYLVDQGYLCTRIEDENCSGQTV